MTEIDVGEARGDDEVLDAQVASLTPEEKVNLAINMVDVCVRVCMDSIKDHYTRISKAHLFKCVQERVEFEKRFQEG